MKILVTYASRMGSTAEIADCIAHQLGESGHQVETRPCTEASAASEYDAVVLGSALYIGRWDKAAVRYLRLQAATLAGRPTWLFQSGPCGERAEDQQVAMPPAVRRLVGKIGLVPPVTFGGRLDRTLAANRLSRWMATGAYAGDFRDWGRVTAWTATVLTALAPVQQPVPPRP